MNSRRLICLFILALICPAASAAPNERKEIIQGLYRRGLAGDKDAVIECIEKLEAVLKREPANQVARVYLGSAYTLRSRDLGFGPKKLSTLKRGLAVMDDAVSEAPDDPKVRLTRALTAAALPSVFGQRATARKDLDWLTHQAETEPSKLDRGDLQIIYYHAGLLAKEREDPVRAIALWQKGLEHPIDPALTARLNEELAKVK